MPNKSSAKTILSDDTELGVHICTCGGVPIKHALLVVDNGWIAGPFFSQAGLQAFVRVQVTDWTSPLSDATLPDMLAFFATVDLPATAMPLDLGAARLELFDTDDPHPFEKHIQLDPNEEEEPPFKDDADGQAKYLSCKNCGRHGWIIDGKGNVLASYLYDQGEALEALRSLYESRGVSLLDFSKVEKEILASNLPKAEVEEGVLS